MKNPIEYIKEAWVIYTKKENFIFFAKIMAVLTLVSIILRYSQWYLSQYVLKAPEIGGINFNFENVPLTVIYIILLVIAGNFYFYSQSITYLSIFNLSISLKEVFVLGYKKMWRFFLISIVLGFIILGGIVLLIIPAVIFGVWYSFSLFLVMDKDLSIKESLSQSKAMVKGKFWKILGRILIFALFGFLIGFVLGFVPYVGSIVVSFLAPLFILPSFLLYRDLSAGLNDLRTV